MAANRVLGLFIGASIIAAFGLRSSSWLLVNLGNAQALRCGPSLEQNAVIGAVRYCPELGTVLFQRALLLDHTSAPALRGALRERFWHGDFASADLLDVGSGSLIRSSDGEQDSVFPEVLALRALREAREDNGEQAMASWYRASQALLDMRGADAFPIIYASGARIFGAAAVHDPSNPGNLFVTGVLLWHSGDHDSAVEYLEAALEHDNLSRLGGLAHSMVGGFYEQQNQRELAIYHYERALERDPELVHVYGRLLILHGQAGHQGDAERVAALIAGLRPMRSLSIRAGDWMLEGISVDPTSLEAMGPVYIVLFWRAMSEGALPGEVGWYEAGDHWLQVLQLRNLVQNGGFEADRWTGPGIPSRFTYWESEGVPADRFGLYPSVRGGQVSKVLRLGNDRTFQRLNLYSNLFLIGEGDLLCGGAWVRGGAPQGARTIVVFRSVNGELQWGAPAGPRFLALGPGNQDQWYFSVNCIAAPLQVEEGLLTISSFESEHSAEFDDVFLVQVPQ